MSSSQSESSTEKEADKSGKEEANKDGEDTDDGTNKAGETKGAGSASSSSSSSGSSSSSCSSSSVKKKKRKKVKNKKKEKKDKKRKKKSKKDKKSKEKKKKEKKKRDKKKEKKKKRPRSGSPHTVAGKIAKEVRLANAGLWKPDGASIREEREKLLRNAAALPIATPGNTPEVAVNSNRLEAAKQDLERLKKHQQKREAKVPYTVRKPNW
mmetsp:Transcript_3200/g.6293  ORF Transcript_3200/g.6293 Transcript_3200/m.6293 type:complete len:210 (+) Transcript_3200:110-739(+)